MTFVVGKSPLAPPTAPAICGHLEVFRLPDGKTLHTGYDRDVRVALTETRYMAGIYGIQFILIRELGDKLPADLWAEPVAVPLPTS
jgi:hypothetical protein